MSKSRIEGIQEMYKYTTVHSAKAAEKFPADKRLFQVKPGKGHALWQLGHMTMALDLIVNQWVLGKDGTIPGDWVAKFAPDVMGGQDPHGDAAGYPSWDEVFDAYKKVAQRTHDLIGELSDADLAGELKGNVPPPAKSFFGNVGQTLVGMAMHDSHHEGQMALLKGASK